MEFLKTIRRRSFLSESAYILLNVLFAVAILFVVRATDTPVLAFVLVLLSKWRVFAVRPRFWAANIQANLVDVLVSVSAVLLLASIDNASGLGFVIQVIITILHIAWLVWVKPQSSKRGVVLQAGIALFVSTAALFIVSYAWPASLVVLAMWLIGYVTARHVVPLHKDDHGFFMSLLWGFVLAFVGWIAYHWTIAYAIPFTNDLVRIPQISIIVFCLGLIFYKVYASYMKHEQIRGSDVLLPTLFGVSVIALLVFLFSGVQTGLL